MLKQLAIVSLGLPVAVLLAADAAWACSCDPPPVPTSFENAQLVVSGLVTAIRLDTQTRLLRIEVNVRESFKADAASQMVAIYTAPCGVSCYGFDFHVGRGYVIFATTPTAARYGPPPKVPANGLIVALCGGTAEIGNLHGNRALEQLRKLVKRK